MINFRLDTLLALQDYQSDAFDFTGFPKKHGYAHGYAVLDLKKPNTLYFT